jgi:dTDP-4-amino-4,6-dideoxygalactose transaminase
MKHQEPPTFTEPQYVTRPLLPDLDRYHELLAEIWSTGRVSNFGPFHARLEQRLSERMATPHITVWTNGTTALLAAVRALGLEGEVITSPFTFPATVHALAWMGITPVFADIDPVTLSIDPKGVADSIGPHTTGVLGVHVYGNWCDTEGIAELARANDLAVLYDAAHCFGMSIAGLPKSRFGDATMFSFHATKLFHTGEGAMLVARDAAMADKFRRLRNFGIVGEDDIPDVGINGKLNELQCALGLLMVDEVDAEIERRTIVGGWYEDQLGDIPGFKFVSGARAQRSKQYLIVRVDASEFGMTRDDLHLELRRFNIIGRRYFYPLCSRLKPYSALPSSEPTRLPNAELAAVECLALPMHGALSESTVTQICDVIRWIHKRGTRRR